MVRELRGRLERWHYTRTTTTSTIEHQDPAKILIGGELHLSGEDLHNKQSQILVGQKVLLDDKVFTQSTNDRLRSSKSKLENDDLIGEAAHENDVTWFVPLRSLVAANC